MSVAKVQGYCGVIYHDLILQICIQSGWMSPIGPYHHSVAGQLYFVQMK